MEFFRIRKDIPFMRHALVFNIISLITFIADEETSRVEGPEGSVRLRSRLSGDNLPAKLAGNWSVDVETEDGQLVGRTTFLVAE